MVNLKVSEGTDTDSNINSYVPVGAIISIMSTTVPDGWLKCDGAAVSRTTYKNLWDVLRGPGSTSPFGNGDGSTTFNTPNLSAKYPRVIAGSQGGGTGNKTTDSPTSTTNRTVGNVTYPTTNNVNLDHGHNTGYINQWHGHNWSFGATTGGPNNTAMNSGPTNAAGQAHTHYVAFGSGTDQPAAQYNHYHGVGGSSGAITGHTHDIEHDHGTSWEIGNMKAYYIIKY